MAAHCDPAMMPATTIANTTTGVGSECRNRPTPAAPTAPMYSWPSPPTRAGSRRHPGHHQADPLHVGLVSAHHAGDTTAVHHRDAVGEVEDLVEILADHQNPEPLLSRLDQQSAHAVGRTDVEPPSG